MDVTSALDATVPPREEPRCYMGASGIGHECDAYVAFCLRGMPEAELGHRTWRIFQMGHVIEDLVLRSLRDAGLVVKSTGADGKQLRVSYFSEFFRGHLDGELRLDDEAGDSGDVAVLEIKSMAAKYWRKLVRHGLAKSHPQYLTQMQALMGLGGYERALLVAMNKDTAEFHHEWVSFDERQFSAIRTRALRILAGACERIASHAKDWRCRRCFKRDGCWNLPKGPARDCRQCQEAQPSQDGRWYCLRHDREADALCDDFRWFRPHPCTS